MKRLLLIAAVVLLWTTAAAGQGARTAERIVEIPFSRLNEGNPPDSSVRVLLNGTPGTTPCTSGSVKVFAIKLNGVWQCPRLSPGVGTGDMLGADASVAGELVLFADSSGKSAARSNTLNGIPFLTSGVVSVLASTGTGNVVRASSATLTAPTLLTPTIAANAFANAQHPHETAQGGGQLNASNVFSSGTIPPERVITGVLSNNRCLRLSNVGQIEVAAEDCGSGGGGTPGGVSGNLAFNESGSFGGVSNSAYDSVTGRLTLNQKVDGNDTFYSQRVTDTTPTGSFLKFRNADGSADLFLVSADGSVYLSSRLTAQNIAAPAVPTAGRTVIWTDKNLKAQDDAGNVSITLRPIACSGTDKISSISSSGVVTCTADQGGAGTGVITLNTLNTSDQSFVTVDDANIDLAIASSISTHTFSVTWVGRLDAARQDINTVHDDTANTWTTGAQSFAAATSLTVPSSAGAAPTVSGQVAYDTTSNTAEIGVNGTNRTIAFTAGSQTFSDKTLDNSTTANLRDTLLTLQDNADSTKTLNFELSAIASGTNRVVSIPNANSVTVQPTTSTTNQFVTHIDSAGVVQKAQPSFANLTGSMDATQGGTGLTSYAQGDMLYASAANTLAKLNKSTVATRYIANTGASNNPIWDQVNLTNGVTGILPGTNGGTSNGFMQFSGPATSLKTYTLPNSSATILTDAALVTGAQGGTNNAFFQVSGPATSLKTFTFPNANATVLTDNAAVTIAQGGTGQVTQTAAFNALDPLTTKGDLITHDGTNSVRLAIGTNGFALIADSTQTAGVRWGAITASAGGSNTQLQYNSSGSLAGISGATTDGTITTFGAGNIIIGSTATLPTAALGKLGVDSDDGTLFYGIDGTTWGEVFVAGKSIVNIALHGTDPLTSNVTGILPPSATEHTINSQTGTSYSVVDGDRGKLIAQSNASAVAYTLPSAAGAGFDAGWYVAIQNRGAGTVTITPTTSTIDGAASLNLTQNQGVWIFSDGTNYFTQRGIGGGGGGGTPGGSDTQVQFNDSAAFGGDAGLTYNKTTDVLTVAGSITLSASGAGYLELAEGTAPAAVSNRVSLAAPADVTESGGWVLVLPATNGASGQFLQTDGSGNTTWATPSGSGDVVGPASATDEALVRFDTTTGKLLQNSPITLSDAGALTLPDNVRQTFNPGANAAGVNVGSLAGDPDTPSNGDLWYDSTANELTARINGANVALGAGGGGGANTALSNLSSVAINTLLASDTDLTDDLGTVSIRWRDLHIGGISISGKTLSTEADNSAGMLLGVMTLTKNDTNTRTFFGSLWKPTLNAGGSNTNTTYNVLGVDTTNTSTTGVTTNLLNLAYGGSTKLTVSSDGALSINGSGAGYLELAEGSAPSLVANRFQIVSPADVAAGGLTYILPGTAASGVLRATNSSGTMTLTHDAGVSHLATSTSADLRSVLSDESGTGAALFAGGDIGAGLATTPSANDNDTSIATTAYVQSELSAYASDTKTNTNTTYDTEGTGNVFTSSHKVFLPAAGCQNTSASSFWDLPTTTPAVAACVTGTNTQKGVLDFADTSGGFSAQTTLALPGDFAGTIDARIYWTTTATSGNVEWSLSTICTATDATETDDPAFNTASAVVTAAPGVASRVQTSAITSVTITGCAANEVLHVRLFRDGNDAQDTLSATVRFIGLEFTLRRAQ